MVPESFSQPRYRIAVKIVCGLFLASFSIFHFPFSISEALAAPLTYRHKHFLFTIDPLAHPEWKTPSEEWTKNGVAFEPPSSFRVDGDALQPLPAGVERRQTVTWNRAAIRDTLEKIVAKALNRPAGNVVIGRNEEKKIVFEGVGLTGRMVDTGAAADLTIAAIARDVSQIDLPVEVTQPVIHVKDPELAAQGITEVVTVGESDFSRSPVNRRFNIAVGLEKFNGHLIPAGGTFSFTTVLGPVDGSTGYRRELVIKGDRTEPDYGGGLCQVSTTAYRGIWEYGFPIVKRKNHSYTVNHYAPAGTDATVYPGSADMVFRNDMPTALLMQTHAEGDLAYFIYYGTKDNRKTDLVGPFITGRREPPPDRTEYTADLPAGEKKKLNERVPGLTSVWYRFVDKGEGVTKPEKVVSIYEARPLFTAIGTGRTGQEIAEEFVEDINTPEPPRIF